MNPELKDYLNKLLDKIVEDLQYRIIYGISKKQFDEMSEIDKILYGYIR